MIDPGIQPLRTGRSISSPDPGALAEAARRLRAAGRARRPGVQALKSFRLSGYAPEVFLVHVGRDALVGMWEKDGGMEAFVFARSAAAAAPARKLWKAFVDDPGIPVLDDWSVKGMFDEFVKWLSIRKA